MLWGDFGSEPQEDHRVRKKSEVGVHQRLEEAPWFLSQQLDRIKNTELGVKRSQRRWKEDGGEGYGCIQIQPKEYVEEYSAKDPFTNVPNKTKISLASEASESVCVQPHYKSINERYSIDGIQSK